MRWPDAPAAVQSQPRSQCFSLDELRDDERRVPVVAELEDREDVRCDSLATLIASRSNRVSATGSLASSVDSTLMATSRSSRGSRAR
jgi:hypothetical protein